MVGALLMGCRPPGSGSSRGDAADRHGPAANDPQFSDKAAWNHMQALNQIGSRASGSAGSADFRAYLRRRLRKSEIVLKERQVSVAVGVGTAVGLTHLTAVIPGRSKDVLLLAAHYDTSPRAPKSLRRNDQQASGSALLLELARVLSAAPMPAYTIWLTWIDGDALKAKPGSPPQVRLGSQSLVDLWIREQEFSRIRTAIFFGKVGHPDRPLARDIDSPRIYREIFWEAAHDLGYLESFPPDSQYDVPETGRLTFAKAPLRASIALANQRTKQPDPRSAKETQGRDREASAGFEAVGKVTLEALARIAYKLHKIDQFARSPLTAGREQHERLAGSD